jgi:predicted transcriptional regulator
MSNVHDAFADFPTSETLLVTVESADEAYRAGLEEIRTLERGESVEGPDTISFPSAESLFETFTPRTIRLLETIAEGEPESIRETARLAERDVKNVHTELSELARLGVIRFEEEGRAKRPVFPYRRLHLDVEFATGDGEEEAASA